MTLWPTHSLTWKASADAKLPVLQRSTSMAEKMSSGKVARGIKKW